MTIPASAFRAPDPKYLPPPMPSTMPPLPPDRKPDPEEQEPAKAPGHAVDNKQVEQVTHLFHDNNLSLDNLRITRIHTYDLMTMPKPKPGVVTVVHVQQLYHHLPTHGPGSILVYRFLDGRLDPLEMARANEQERKELAESNIGRKPAITRWQVIEGTHRYSTRDPMVHAQPKDQWQAELVIMKSELNGNAPKHYILAWHVTKKDRALYAFIDATSGKMLSYYNGIRY